MKNQAKRLEFGLRVIGTITENNPLTPSYESAEHGIWFKIEHSEAVNLPGMALLMGCFVKKGAS